MRRRILAMLLTLLMLFALTACGAKSEEAVMNSSASSAPMEEPKAEEYAADMMVGGVQYETGESQTQSETGQKLIRTARLELETTAFDEAAQGLAELTEQYGGYYENSSVANRKNGSRWADYTIRVPAEKYDAFLSQAGELCHETWRETSQEDISESYYDTAGRLKTQQIKLERLQALLAKAEVMEDIITIESAISETEQAIDSLSGTLRHYDGKVEYATVHINLSEVYKLSNVEEVPDTFGQRLGNAFTGGLSDFVDTLEDLAVSFAYSWMWWLLIVVIVVVVVRVVRKKKLPSLRKKRDDKQEET